MVSHIPSSQKNGDARRNKSAVCTVDFEEKEGGWDEDATEEGGSDDEQADERPRFAGGNGLMSGCDGNDDELVDVEEEDDELELSRSEEKSSWSRAETGSMHRVHEYDQIVRGGMDWNK